MDLGGIVFADPRDDVFKAHRRLCHSTLGLRVTKKKKVGGRVRGRPRTEGLVTSRREGLVTYRRARSLETEGLVTWKPKGS